MQNAFLSPLLLSEPTLNKPDGFLAKICFSRLFPPHDKIGHLLTYSLVAVIVWTTLYIRLGRVTILNQEKLDVLIQSGIVFALIFLLVCSAQGGLSH